MLPRLKFLKRLTDFIWPGVPEHRLEEIRALCGVRCVGVEWFELAQDRDQWWDTGSTAMNLRLPQKAEFLREPNEFQCLNQNGASWNYGSWFFAGRCPISYRRSLCVEKRLTWRHGPPACQSVTKYQHLIRSLDFHEIRHGSSLYKLSSRRDFRENRLNDS